MKTVVMICSFCCWTLVVLSQTETQHEQQLQEFVEIDEVLEVDEFFLEQLEKYKKSPINLNQATEEELAALGILSGIQIFSLIQYIKLLGRLIDIYELQAVPGWDLLTIRKILPYISVADNETLASVLRERWRKGEHRLLLRSAFIPNHSLENGDKFLGSGLKLVTKYRYDYKHLLTWGITGEKDAGEPFGKGKQKAGFDFYSFHIFLRKLGAIEAIALGDFTVNMGQGLIQWQSLAFKKSASILNIKRQSAAIRPYSSSSEFNFQRGIGITVRKGKWTGTFFISSKAISVNTGKDSTGQGDGISSFLYSGYHRTSSEVSKKNIARRSAAGLILKYTAGRWHIAANSALYRFSFPLIRSGEPYKLYAAEGKSFVNNSLDYSYTIKNIHLFGEVAIDKNLQLANIHGVLLTVDRNADLSFLYRKISRAYQSIAGNAFTENSTPTNEEGFYTGLALRPSSSITVQAYLDLFHFPWLKYQVNAPSNGFDYLAEIVYKPSKSVVASVRFKSKIKQTNVEVPTEHVNGLADERKSNLRFHHSILLTKEMTWQNRCEMVWHSVQKNKAQGFLIYTDLSYKPPLKPWAVRSRLQLFESEGYQTRIYSYEHQLPMSFSIPAHYGRGFRVAVSADNDITNRQVKALGKFKLQAAVQVAKTFTQKNSAENMSGKEFQLNFQLAISKN